MNSLKEPPRCTFSEPTRIMSSHVQLSTLLYKVLEAVDHVQEAQRGHIGEVPRPEPAIHESRALLSQVTLEDLSGIALCDGRGLALPLRNSKWAFWVLLVCRCMQMYWAVQMRGRLSADLDLSHALPILRHWRPRIHISHAHLHVLPTALKAHIMLASHLNALEGLAR